MSRINKYFTPLRSAGHVAPMKKTSCLGRTASWKGQSHSHEVGRERATKCAVNHRAYLAHIPVSFPRTTSAPYCEVPLLTVSSNDSVCSTPKLSIPAPQFTAVR